MPVPTKEPRVVQNQPAAPMPQISPFLWQQNRGIDGPGVSASPLGQRRNDCPVVPGSPLVRHQSQGSDGAGVPMSPFMRQQSQGSDGAVVHRKTFCFTPRSVSLPLTPSPVPYQQTVFLNGHGAPKALNGFPVRSGSMTIPAASSRPIVQSFQSIPLRQVSCGRNITIPQRTPKGALHYLQLGNSRFQQGLRRGPGVPATMPFATIITATDFPRSIESIFDAQPGSLFVASAHGCDVCNPDVGLLKKLELSTSLGSSLILVLGHKDCTTLLHATQRFMECGEAEFPTIPLAAKNLGPCADTSSVSGHAMALNVARTAQFLQSSSAQLREHVQNGTLEIHSGVFESLSGYVHFMGPAQYHTDLLASPKVELKETEEKTEAKRVPRINATCEKAEAVVQIAKMKEESPPLEKAGGSEASHESQGRDTQGTGAPGTDCEQSDGPTSSHDVADVADVTFGARDLHECDQNVTELADSRPSALHDTNSTANGRGMEEVEAPDMKPLEPEDSQISQASSGTTDAASHASLVSEHSMQQESFPVEVHGGFVAEPLPAAPAPMSAEEEVQDPVNPVNSEPQTEKTEKSKGKTAESGKVLLVPYFALASDLWMCVDRSRGLLQRCILRRLRGEQHLLQQNLMRRLSGERVV